MSKLFISRIRNLLYNKEGILYIAFGALTTFVNVVLYALLYEIFNTENVPATIIAWLVSVLVAFITNKLWVFESKSFAPPVLAKEFFSFFSCRTLTGILDVLIMWAGVDLLSLNATVIKILSNIIVIILNYAVSKLFIFKK